MDRVNIHEPQLHYDDTDPEGYRAGMDRFGGRIGSRRIGGSVYELPTGQSICPYHYELGDEEWLVVLAGRPTVRHPGGEDELGPGDTVCFPEGESGAHKVTNRSDETVRVLMLSTKRDPAVCVYPDGDKIGVFADQTSGGRYFRGDETVDYWDREV